MANKSNSTKSVNSKKNTNNTNKKNNVQTQNKKELNVKETVKEEDFININDDDEDSHVILRLLLIVALIAIIVFMFIKACSKDDSDDKNKKVEDRTDIEEVVSDEDVTYENDNNYSYVTNVSYENKENNVVQETSEVIEEKEEIIDDAPVITGVSEGEIYKSVNISAGDVVTDTENLIVTIDDEPYNLGDSYNKPGKHTVKVVDESGNATEVTFIIGTGVSSEEEFYEALENEEDEAIVILEDFATEDNVLLINRSVKIISKPENTLTMGFIIGEDLNEEELLVCSAEDKIIEFEDVVLNRSESYEEDGLTFNFGIAVSDPCNVTLTLKNSIINVSGENSFGVMVAGHRESTKVILKNSKINNISENIEDITYGVALYDDIDEETSNNLDINKSEINDILYPVIINKKLADNTDITITDSNITEEDVLVIPESTPSLALSPEVEVEEETKKEIEEIISDDTTDETINEEVEE